MGTSPNIAVLIVLYNNEKDLLVLLDSLKKQTYKNFKLFFLNNGMNNYKDLIDKHFVDYYYWDSNINLGFTGGNNFLAEKALNMEFDYLYILNPDMELSSITIEELLKLCEFDKSIGICNCTILYGLESKENEIIQLFGCKANYNTQSKKFLFSNKPLNETKLPDVLEVEYLNTGSLFIRTELVRKIGLFDEDFFMYNEEIDIAKRVKEAGYKVVVTSRTKIWHHHDWSRNNIVSYNIMYYYMMRNRYLYYYKYNLYFFLIFDLIWQLISFPLKVKMFYKLKVIKPFYYYYLGILRGILKEKGKTKVRFE